MGDTMRPVPFKSLIRRILQEYAAQKSIFGIHEIHFFKKHNRSRVRVFNEFCDTPVGPAAGPHTQLAQNIVASYLAGGRFIELKTVQKLDTLEIEKPCIDARDEGYNTEWSTEFTLEKAFDEYLKAWFALHLLEALFDLRAESSQRGFIFNMSVGYDLEGIRTSKMDYFIDSLTDASEHPLFDRYRRELEEILAVEEPIPRDLSQRISPVISPSVTLSTMHGCPPEEQESICRYLLEEKGIDTFLKLNPTLLGYETVRDILDRLGYGYLHLSAGSFAHDLQYTDAVAMLQRLMETAARHGRQFGIKLSNTLGSINDQGVLPGDDMYMSGRALYPLTINLAAKLSREFDGKIPISYAGGANAFNVGGLFAAGIRPVTTATELLKPGGYIRLKEMALKAETAAGWNVSAETAAGWNEGSQGVDVDAVCALAEDALSVDYTRKQFRGSDVISVHDPLPVFDCYVAPCRTACPIGQDVPEYIRLLGEGRYADALDVIYERNALPNITSYICDHQCMFNCTRIDYEGSVKIREMKRVAAEKGWKEYIEKWSRPDKKIAHKAAVVGAGPAGLSAAYFLAREGFEVTVFEKHQSAGGVVRHVIPHFRLPVETIERDVEFIRNHGVEFRFGCDPRLTREELTSQGYTCIFLGIGAEKDNPLQVEGSGNGNRSGKDNMSGTGNRVIRSLDFLWDYRNTPEKVQLGKHVVVIGGGNTAMDSARAARTVPGVKSVTVLYRRSLEQMPADLEEYENAVADGVEFRFLSVPEKIDADGNLTVRRMQLGGIDASGRPRPVPTDETEVMKADILISAIGEKVDIDALKAFGVPIGEDGWPEVDEETLETGLENVYLGGDARTGPSTVVQCIAAGRKAADAIIRKEDPAWKRISRVPQFNAEIIRQEVLPRKGALIRTESIKATGSDELFARHEALRCLQCSYTCNKCVEVCPNRANVAVAVPKDAGFAQDYQIIHIDAFCNECGNCETFCPWEGKPYRDKFTLFNTEEDFAASLNPGFFLNNRELQIRWDGKVETAEIGDEGTVPRGIVDPRAAVLIETIIHKYGYLLGKVEL